MKNLAKITIVTITYNSEKTIERTLKSVLEQNYDNLEYWIIDGLSEDGTMDIVKQYAKDYQCLHFISEKDKGISDAFNKGIARATGELICLINSDDKLADGALIAVQKTYSDTNADVIYGDTIVDDPHNGLKLYKKADNPRQLKYEMPFIHQSCFIKKEVYDRCGGYSSEYKICMDYDYLAKVFFAGYTFAYTNKVLSVFQYGGTSCEHPIRTINEDMRIASNYGLSAIEVIGYKIKHIPINVAKMILSGFKLWGPLYRWLRPNNVVKEK